MVGTTAPAQVDFLSVLLLRFTHDTVNHRFSPGKRGARAGDPDLEDFASTTARVDLVRCL